MENLHKLMYGQVSDAFNEFEQLNNSNHKDPRINSFLTELHNILVVWKNSVNFVTERSLDQQHWVESELVLAARKAGKKYLRWQTELRKKGHRGSQ